MQHDCFGPQTAYLEASSDEAKQRQVVIMMVG